MQHLTNPLYLTDLHPHQAELTRLLLLPQWAGHLSQRAGHLPQWAGHLPQRDGHLPQLLAPHQLELVHPQLWVVRLQLVADRPRL